LVGKEKPTRTHCGKNWAYSLHINTKETMHRDQAKEKEDKYQQILSILFRKFFKRKDNKSFNQKKFRAHSG